MIEAVNSAIANLQVDRSAPAQIDVAKAAANPERVQEARPVVQAPYVSPYIYVDVERNKAVLQIRDSETGDVLKQYPSQSVLEAQVEAETTRQSVLFEAADRPKTEKRVQTSSASNVQPTRSDVRTAVAALVAASQSGQSALSSVSVTA